MSTKIEAGNPVAYAIYGISGGRASIVAVKLIRDAPDGPENWESDDGGWGERWGGNVALVPAPKTTA